MHERYGHIPHVREHVRERARCVRGCVRGCVRERARGHERCCGCLIHG